MDNLQSDYLTKHLITYIGNKRKLLAFINAGVEKIKMKLGKNKLSMLDGFSGSGCVARLLKSHSSTLYVNDLEAYSTTLNKCYLTNASQIDLEQVSDAISYLNEHKLDSMEIGFIEKNYAPHDDNSIKAGERVFFTNKNAKIIDNVRRLIRNEYETNPAKSALTPYLLAPLIVATSIHTNTSGVFKGFHKKNGVGHFGGAGENALVRIMGDISLNMPIFSPQECEVNVLQGDINSVIKSIPEIDVAYFDPPYNQHPYGSNYFMLNIVNNYDDPKIQDGVSGIIQDWNKSHYNKNATAEQSMIDLIENTKAKYLIFSYNDEGIIGIKNFSDILCKYGNVECMRQAYHAYRGSRNLQDRDNKVSELLWILEKTNTKGVLLEQEIKVENKPKSDNKENKAPKISNKWDDVCQLSSIEDLRKDFTERNFDCPHGFEKLQFNHDYSGPCDIMHYKDVLDGGFIFSGKIENGKVILNKHFLQKKKYHFEVVGILKVDFSNPVVFVRNGKYSKANVIKTKEQKISDRNGSVFEE